MYQVIFADGTFIDGSTSELSCDGPLREPFAVFCQVRACVHGLFSRLRPYCFCSFEVGQVSGSWSLDIIDTVIAS